jgi:hypothetical protein
MSAKTPAIPSQKTPLTAFLMNKNRVKNSSYGLGSWG